MNVVDIKSEPSILHSANIPHNSPWSRHGVLQKRSFPDQSVPTASSVQEYCPIMSLWQAHGCELRQPNSGLRQYHPGLRQSHPGLRQSYPGLRQSHPLLRQSHPGLIQANVAMRPSFPGLRQSHLQLKQPRPELSQSNFDWRQSHSKDQECNIQHKLDEHPYSLRSLKVDQNSLDNLRAPGSYSEVGIVFKASKSGNLDESVFCS